MGTQSALAVPQLGELLRFWRQERGKKPARPLDGYWHLATPSELCRKRAERYRAGFSFCCLRCLEYPSARAKRSVAGVGIRSTIQRAKHRCRADDGRMGSVGERVECSDGQAKENSGGLDRAADSWDFRLGIMLQMSHFRCERDGFVCSSSKRRSPDTNWSLTRHGIEPGRPGRLSKTCRRESK